MARRSPSGGATSALRVAQQVFDAATNEPTNLFLRREELAAGVAREVREQLPAGRILLRPLRDLLLRRQTPLTVRDAVWQELILRARADRSSWLLMALGMAMPGLRRGVRALAVSSTGDRDDLESAVTEGFVAELYRVDVTATALCARLLRAAHRAGVKQAYQDAAAQCAPWSDFASGAPHAPWGHPDFVLVDAVRAGVLSPQEAWLIGATRLEGLAVDEAATVLDERANTVTVRRHRAEHRLRDAVIAGKLSGAAMGATSATRPDRDALRNGLVALPAHPRCGGQDLPHGVVVDRAGWRTGARTRARSDRRWARRGAPECRASGSGALRGSLGHHVPSGVGALADCGEQRSGAPTVPVRAAVGDRWAGAPIRPATDVHSG